MRRNSIKKQKRKEFDGKSEDYQAGYVSAEDYFKLLMDGTPSHGGAPFRIFVEVVAHSMRNKEEIDTKRFRALGLMLDWSSNEFNLGVYDFLVKAVEDYNKGGK